MPTEHRKVEQFAESPEALRLVVNQCLEGADGQDEAGLWSVTPAVFSLILEKASEQWKERSFCFACRRRRGEDDVALAGEQRSNGLLLNGAQRRPALRPDPLLDSRIKQKERVLIRA